MRGFLAEVRAREGQGYSVRQLVKSHIPDIGGEVKVSEAEVVSKVREARYFSGFSTGLKRLV